MTIKDSVAVLDAKSGAAQPLRRGDAVGAEIPVTVHASRTSQELGKNLPPVHEETRTVIVLPQGAVVRLTAMLTLGETVVLTNRMTGVDVLCRVGNVKSQPGIQHYVDLEFTQRAPSFWGHIAPAQGTSVLEAPAPAGPKPSVPPAVAVKPPTPAAQPPVIAAPTAVAIPNPAVETLRPTPLAESVSGLLPGPQPKESRAVRPIRPATASRASTYAAPVPRAPRLLAEEPSGAQGRSGTSWRSKKGYLAAAASILLVVGTAVGGYWFYGQERSLPEMPVPQQAVSFPQYEAAPPLLRQDEPPLKVTAAALDATRPPTEAEIVVESRPSAERPVNRVEPSPAPVARAPQRAVRRNSVTIGKLQAPVPRTLPSTSVSGEAPPMIVGAAVDLGFAGTDSALLAGAGTSAAPPPPGSRPGVGGQLQPPRLISSTPPVYPAAARAQRVQGVVILDALVDETGKVAETTVISGPLSLQSAAKEALQSWKYEPARLNGEPIPIHTKVNLRFNLN